MTEGDDENMRPYRLSQGQRLAVNRAIFPTAASPALSKSLRAALETAGESHREVFNTVGKRFSASVAASLATNFSSVDVKSAYGNRWSDIQRQFRNWPTPPSLTSSIEPMLSKVRSKWLEDVNSPLLRLRWGKLAKAFEEISAWTRGLPPNLRSFNFLPRSKVDEILADPIPLYAVPRSATVAELMACKDAQARRTLIGRRRDSIVNDCDEVLGQITNPAYAYEVSSLIQAIRAMRSGHWEAGQALAANVMDTFVWGWNDPSGVSRSAFTGRGRSESRLDSLDIETYVVMRPVYFAHESFRANDRHVLIPRIFNRHASLHRVSARQYSQRNAVIALMMATSLGWYFNQNY